MKYQKDFKNIRNIHWRVHGWGRGSNEGDT